MTPTLFITGGTGFVGRQILRVLSARGQQEIRLLVRDPAAVSPRLALAPHWQVVRGTLDDPEGWASTLAGVDTVLHLASSTGKAHADAHHATIVRGTEQLIRHAEAARVRRVLFVSSVAAGFADQRSYPYAQAKRLAEARVLASRLDTLVVRPTMVLGPGSAPLEGLRRLARLRRPVIFGSGTTLVQPIHVADLAQFLVSAIEEVAPWGQQVVSAGGEEVLTIEALTRAIRRTDGLDDVAPVHVPIEPLRTLLALVEPALRRVLPFTAGQLLSFTQSGVAGDSSALVARLTLRGEPYRRLHEMLSNAAHDAH